MSFSIRLSDEEKKLADSYAKMHSMSLSEAFKTALFEKIEDEYDIKVYNDAHVEYVENGSQSRPVSELWKELGL